jgi:hypothetical protein
MDRKHGISVLSYLVYIFMRVESVSSSSATVLARRNIQQRTVRRMHLTRQILSKFQRRSEDAVKQNNGYPTCDNIPTHADQHICNPANWRRHK